MMIMMMTKMTLLTSCVCAYKVPTRQW